MIPYPRRSSLRYRVSNKNTCRGYVLESDDTHNALVDYSGRVEGMVEVWDQLVAIASS